MASFLSNNTSSKNMAQKSISLQNELQQRISKGLLKDTGIGLESFVEAARVSGDEAPEVAKIREVARTVVDSAYGEGTFDNELEDGQRDAAVLSLVAAADGAGAQLRVPEASIESFKVGTETTKDGTIVNSFGLPNIARFGGDVQTVRREFSNEVFDGRSIDNYVKSTVAFHILAARQTPAAEAMYPTFAIAPDQSGYSIECERPLVFNQIWHNIDGSTIDFNRHRKLLLLAYQDHTILQNTSTTLKPYWTEENKQYFVDTALVPTTKYGVAPEDDFDTSWLAVDKTFSLIGLGQNPELAKLGQANTTDTLDQRMALDRLLLEVTTADGTSYIPFSVKHLAYTQFNAATEGQQTKMVLTFSTEDLTLHRDIKDVNGQTPTALNTLINTYPDHRVTIAVDVNGRTILESSETRVQKATAEVKDVFKVVGTGVEANIEMIDPAEADTIAKLFTTITVIGFKLEAYLTNFNRAIHGPLVTTERFRDVHMVPLGAPITAQYPVVDVANPTVDVTAPAQTLMIRNSNNAFTQLFNFEEILAMAQLALSGRNASIPQIRAIGRWLLARPWYDYRRYVLTDEINSLTTADRNDNISAGICNSLRLMINTGYYHTNFQAAMEVSGVAAGTKPKIVLVCNPIVANYLYTKGDSRTLGDGWEFDIVPDADRRLIDRDEDGNQIFRIYAFFKVDGADGPHPLNFGNMIYKPDLATQLPITRNNRTTIEFTVQPWTLHVNHCPVLFRLDVVGLKEAASGSMPIRQTIV